MQYQQYVINQAIEYIKNKYEIDTHGYDGSHHFRVWQMARFIADQEGADQFIVEVAALLHNTSHCKGINSHLMNESIAADKWLSQFNLEGSTVQTICNIHRDMSLLDSGRKRENMNLETLIVHDADCLDALGAVGIAQFFMAQPHMRNFLMEPRQHPNNLHQFFEKLLSLKTQVYTTTAQKIADDRYRFSVFYLHRLMSEWNIDLTQSPPG